MQGEDGGKWRWREKRKSDNEKLCVKELKKNVEVRGKENKLMEINVWKLMKINVWIFRKINEWK